MNRVELLQNETLLLLSTALITSLKAPPLTREIPLHVSAELREKTNQWPVYQEK
jgi:hypothetical protein